jgi:hypothetical protein
MNVIGEEDLEKYIYQAHGRQGVVDSSNVSV